MMKIGYVIYFSSGGCALWSWRGQQFEPTGARTPVGVDPGPVVAELAQLEPAPVAVLVDIIDEEHVRDSIARLGRRDQQALLERKLVRAFPRTAYRSVQVQGRNPAKPDENQILISALTRPEPLRILMQRLADARIAVAGIYTPAVLSQHLLDQPARSHPAVLLALRRRNGRWQHSFFRQGMLVGSRRLRASAVSPEEDAGLFLAQVEESLRYFDPGFTVGADHPLQLLTGSKATACLQVAGVCGEGWQLRALPLAEIRRSQRIRAELSEDESERWFIELLRRQARSHGFAPQADRRYCHLLALRTFAKVASFAVAGITLAGAFNNALIIADARDRAAMFAETTQAMATVLPETLDKNSPEASPLEMRDTVEVYEALRARRADPAAILATLSAAVSQRPAIRVDGIHWGMAGSAPAVVEEAAPDEVSMHDPPGAAEPGRLTVTVEGRIEPFDGVYPRAFDELQAFMRALRTLPLVEKVQSIREPLDVNPASTLSGEIAPGGAPAQAVFTVEILMRPGHESA